MTRIAGVLLAAGASRRFGEDAKLMAPIEGRRLVDYAAEPLIRAGLSPLIALIQPEDEPLAIILETEGFDLVENPRFAEGMGTSIAAGAARARELGADGAVVALGDMPFVGPETIARLVATFAPEQGRTIVVASDGSRRGCPALFGRAHFAELMALTKDEGARAVAAAHPGQLSVVDCAPGELDDVDTLEALEAARARLAIPRLRVRRRHP
jgi:molybdenum cofactor cytidylyltransferase